MSPPGRVVAAMLGLDFSRLREELDQFAEAGVDGVQWDVMDLDFVPQLTLGPDVIAACRGGTALPFEAHLMVSRPELLVRPCVDAGCSRVIVHAESTQHLHHVLAGINDLGAAAGIALNPATGAHVLDGVLELVDQVTVMGVNPGFRGERFIPAVLPKIAAVAEKVAGSDPRIRIEVDGGLTPAAVRAARGAGADTFVAASGLIAHPGGRRAAVTEFRQAIAEGS